MPVSGWSSVVNRINKKISVESFRNMPPGVVSGQLPSYPNSFYIDLLHSLKVCTDWFCRLFEY